MVFILVISGFVISEIWSEWNVTDTYTLIPDFLKNYLLIEKKILLVLCTNLVLFVILPLIIWSLPLLVVKINGATLKLKDYLFTYGIAFIPIIAAAHFDKAILKTISRLPYFKYLYADITGMKTAQGIIDGKLKLQSNPVWMNILVSVLLTLVMIAGIWLSMMVIKRLNLKRGDPDSNDPFYLIPFVYGGIFLVMIVVWRWF